MSLLTPMLRSSPLTDWFSDAQRVQGMLDFEAALAQAQAACGWCRRSGRANCGGLPPRGHRFCRAGRGGSGSR
ncbi:3-carboxy-cis,cis-muconate cycloisomerase [Klebsiella pneumoniae]|uniref:3-carboxy-cis,cis-muconate cycloisomerase n=1 Tax=Klebsiella pneumoniae TaxID=573 RepID=A0A377UZ89_KLEPN|nr:3-carboxy-cis,cis-muconate cycloisomerase [Klebsiella pneumoniae]